MEMEIVEIQEESYDKRTRKEKIFYKLYEEIDNDKLNSFTQHFYIYDKFVFKKDMINYVVTNYSLEEIGEYITSHIDPEYMKTFNNEMKTHCNHYNESTKNESPTKNICPFCKKVNKPSDNFCIYCGGRVGKNYENTLKSIYKKMIEGTIIQAPYEKMEIKTRTELKTFREPAHTVTEHRGSYSYSTHYPSYTYTKEVEIKEREKIPSYKNYKAYFDLEKMVLSGKQKFKEIFYDDVIQLEYPKIDGNEEVTLILKNDEKIHLKLYTEQFSSEKDKKIVFEAFKKTFVEQGNNLPDEYFK